MTPPHQHHPPPPPSPHTTPHPPPVYIQGWTDGDTVWHQLHILCKWPFELRHGWIFTSHCFMWMALWWDLIARCSYSWIQKKIAAIWWTTCSKVFSLTHWGRVTHICVGKLTIIGSDNGLSPGRRQAIIWTNAGILLIGPLETNFQQKFEFGLRFQFILFQRVQLTVSHHWLGTTGDKPSSEPTMGQ